MKFNQLSLVLLSSIHIILSADQIDFQTLKDAKEAYKDISDSDDFVKAIFKGLPDDYDIGKVQADYDTLKGEVDQFTTKKEEAELILNEAFLLAKLSASDYPKPDSAKLDVRKTALKEIFRILQLNLEPNDENKLKEMLDNPTNEAELATKYGTLKGRLDNWQTTFTSDSEKVDNDNDATRIGLLGVLAEALTTIEAANTKLTESFGVEEFEKALPETKKNYPEISKSGEFVKAIFTGLPDEYDIQRLEGEYDTLKMKVDKFKTNLEEAKLILNEAFLLAKLSASDYPKKKGDNFDVDERKKALKKIFEILKLTLAPKDAEKQKKMLNNPTNEAELATNYKYEKDRLEKWKSDFENEALQGDASINTHVGLLGILDEAQTAIADANTELEKIFKIVPQIDLKSLQNAKLAYQDIKDADSFVKAIFTGLAGNVDYEIKKVEDEYDLLKQQVKDDKEAELILNEAFLLAKLSASDYPKQENAKLNERKTALKEIFRILHLNLVPDDVEKLKEMLDNPINEADLATKYATVKGRLEQWKSEFESEKIANDKDVSTTHVGLLEVLTQAIKASETANAKLSKSFQSDKPVPDPETIEPIAREQREELKKENDGKAPEIQANCNDKAANCEGMWRMCSIAGYVQQMHQNCARTCRICMRPDDICQDSLTECAMWNSKGYCGSAAYTKAVKIRQCGKTCNLCPTP